MDREKDKQDLLNLHHGKECTVAWFEEGGGLVLRAYDVFVLFEVPQYGGIPCFYQVFHETQIENLLDVAYNWT